MKKVILICGPFFVFGLLGVNCLAAPKVPAKICLQPDNYFIDLAIVTKSAGSTMSLKDGNLKFSHVVGEMVFTVLGQSIPIKGSGHLSGEVFHFNANGNGWLEVLNHWSTVEFEAKWNVLHDTGWWRLLWVQRSSTGDQVGLITYTGTNLHEISCTNVTVPY